MNCRYCGAAMPEGEGRCPSCGALDPYFTAAASEAQTAQEPPVAQTTSQGNIYQQVPAQDHTYGQAPAQGNPYGQAPVQKNPYGQVSAQGQIPVGTPNLQNKNRQSVRNTVLSIVAWFAVAALLAVGFNVFHRHSSFLSKGETVNMDVILGRGGDFPVGEFVHVDAPFVLDQFATEETKINGVTSQKDCYYYVLLNSRRCIAVKAATVEQIDALEKTLQDTVDYLDKKIDSFDDIPLEGKLVIMTDKELIQYYDAYSEDMGFLDDDSYYTPEYYMIDTTAVRSEKALLFIVLPVCVAAVGAALTVIVKRSKKKKAEAAAAFSAQG